MPLALRVDEPDTVALLDDVEEDVCDGVADGVAPNERDDVAVPLVDRVNVWLPVPLPLLLGVVEGLEVVVEDEVALLVKEEVLLEVAVTEDVILLVADDD